MALYRNLIKHPIRLLILVLVLPTVFSFLAIIILTVSSFVPKSASLKFYTMTQLHLPKSAYDIHDFSDPPNFLGDGVREFSFRISQEDLVLLLTQKPFKKFQWGKVEKIDVDDECYFTQRHGDVCDGTLNSFWGTNNDIKFRNDGSLLSAVKSRSPNPEYPYSNYTEIMVSQDKLWVLVTELDT